LSAGLKLDIEYIETIRSGGHRHHREDHSGVLKSSGATNRTLESSSKETLA